MLWLTQHLVTGNEDVHEVNPRWTAAGRRRARKAGKSDRLDAKAVAILVRQERTSLPRVTADDESVVLDLLVTERGSALAEATRLRNQIHQPLLHIDPEYRQHLPNLQSQAGLATLESYAVTSDNDDLQQQRASSIRRLAQRLRLAVDQIKDLTRQVHVRAGQQSQPLTQVCGVSLLTAVTPLHGSVGTHAPLRYFTHLPL